VAVVEVVAKVPAEMMGPLVQVRAVVWEVQVSTIHFGELH